MKISLTQGLDVDEKSRVVSEYKASPSYRARLQTVLENEISLCYKAIEGDDAQKHPPNWEFSVLEKLAQIRSFRKLISLL